MSKRLIWAEDAIDAVHNLYAIFGSEGEWVDRKDVFEAINSLPSAQPQWIPVTERLPEVGQWVLCQCRAGIIDVLRLTDDDCWYRKSDMIYMSGFVLAWMPLPEPYAERRQDADR